MRRLVLIAAIYAALTASFVGRAAQPADAPAAGSPAAAMTGGGTSHHLSTGRVLWVPAGSPAPRLERRLTPRRWTPAAPAVAPETVLVAAGARPGAAR